MDCDRIAGFRKAGFSCCSSCHDEDEQGCGDGCEYEIAGQTLTVCCGVSRYLDSLGPAVNLLELEE